METAKVFCNYEDCKCKRVSKDFSAFVHVKTAKVREVLRGLQGWQTIGETLALLIV